MKDIKSMWNTMKCKRDSFSGVLGGAKETHWERVSHALKSCKRENIVKRRQM